MKRIVSEEIAEALREELQGGRYKAGSVLPSVDSLRRRFGAGEFAVRHALQRLRDKGLVSLKQGIGAVATGIAPSEWTGRIAFIAVDTSASYFRQKLAIQLAKRFRGAGWDFVPIFIDEKGDGLMDMSQVRRCAANGLDFAILITDQAQVAEVCDGLPLPYVVLNGYIRDFPNARAVIREDFGTCFADLIRTMRVRKVKTLLEFDFERKMDRSFKSQLFEAGIAVRRVLCKRRNEEPFRLCDVKRLGYEAVIGFFAGKTHLAHPPDAILFDDDYMAEGGITALGEIGLRIPEDVKVVTYSNSGNEPVAGVSLARIDNDPVSYGDAVAEYVVKLLSGRRAAPPRISWRFIPGESL
ncbi:MAG: substrate-binding domain-containing protein [Kiritimatiellae bacterium]|nr:substrate-binding domain-containing protein [Kiritimatiellia bacterium]